MKKVVLAALVVAMVASASNAAILSMRWADTAEKTKTLAVSDTAQIEVVWTMQAGIDKKVNGSILTSVLARFDGIAGDPKATVDSVTTAVPGWDALVSEGVGGNLNAFYMALNAPAASAINGNNTTFSTVIATITIHCAGATAEPVAIAFRNLDPLPGAFNGPSTWALDYPVAPTAAGHFTMGVGAPGYVNQGVYDPKPTTPADPLYLIQTPEPAALALLALGGLALLRRK